jgi:hypothetical protein
VPFSAAGHVLRPGAKYYLHVIFVGDKDLESVRLAAPPDFIKAQPATNRLNDEGNRVFEIQFRVDRGLRSIDIEAEDLDLEFAYRPESGKPLQQLRLPIVIRPGWRFLLLSTITALLAFIVPIWFHDSGHKPEDATNLEKFQSLAFGPLPWLLAGLIVCAVGALYVYVFFQLRHRARNLWGDFRTYCASGHEAEPEE